MSTDAIQFAGEFAIEELKIVTPTEQVADLISDVLVIEINIFEDIFSNTLSGNIMLTDIRDIITLLPIQGQEELFLKIKTPSGVVLHTGDWKCDPNPLIGNKIDEQKLKKIGDEGVLAMICDSTNVFSVGRAGSEMDVRKHMLNLIQRLKKRIIVTGGQGFIGSKIDSYFIFQKA